MYIIWEKENGTKVTTNNTKESIAKAKELGWKKVREIDNFPSAENIEETISLAEEREAFEKEKAELQAAKEELEIDKAKLEDEQAASKKDKKK